MEITLKDGKKYETSYVKFEGFNLIFIPLHSLEEIKVYVRDMQTIIHHENAD